MSDCEPTDPQNDAADGVVSPQAPIESPEPGGDSSSATPPSEDQHVPVEGVDGDRLAEAEPDEADESDADGEVDAETVATVEAVLFATDTPLNAGRIAQVAELSTRGRAKRAIAALNDRYEQMGCAFRVEQIAGGYQMLTLPEYNDVLSNLLRARKDSRLSQAALETLAIVAYRQPILRADVEAIRGVASGEVLRGLMERSLVKIVGRAEVLGRPMLYGTTKRFLEVFGLASLKDLPNAKELRRPSAPPEGESKAETAGEPGQAGGAEDASPSAEAESTSPADDSAASEGRPDGAADAPADPEGRSET